jgi:hypothetical protein
MPTFIDECRANFAVAHGGQHIVQLGRGRSLLPGVLITPENIADDARTVSYVARMVDDLNPAHMRDFRATWQAIPACANFSVISSDDLGAFARWSMTFDTLVVAITV